MRLLTVVIASWYGMPQETACGPYFDPEKMTCAHKTLPCGSRVKVSRGNRSVVCTITDRGPYVRGRTLDLSRAAARKLGMLDIGVAKVKMEVLEQSTPSKRHNYSLWDWLTSFFRRAISSFSSST